MLRTTLIERAMTWRNPHWQSLNPRRRSHFSTFLKAWKWWWRSWILWIFQQISKRLISRWGMPKTRILLVTTLAYSILTYQQFQSILVCHLDIALQSCFLLSTKRLHNVWSAESEKPYGEFVRIFNKTISSWNSPGLVELQTIINGNLAEKNKKFVSMGSFSSGLNHILAVIIPWYISRLILCNLFNHFLFLPVFL